VSQIIYHVFFSYPIHGYPSTNSPGLNRCPPYTAWRFGFVWFPPDKARRGCLPEQINFS
jgi:hypothetical protein